MPLGSHHKADIAGSLVSLAFIWALTLWVTVRATKVWFAADKVHGGRMLIVGIVSLAYVLREHVGKQFFKQTAQEADLGNRGNR